MHIIQHEKKMNRTEKESKLIPKKCDNTLFILTACFIIKILMNNFFSTIKNSIHLSCVFRTTHSHVRFNALNVLCISYVTSHTFQFTHFYSATHHFTTIHISSHMLIGYKSLEPSKEFMVSVSNGSSCTILLN
jgi:hypothetical protein